MCVHLLLCLGVQRDVRSIAGRLVLLTLHAPMPIKRQASHGLCAACCMNLHSEQSGASRTLSAACSASAAAACHSRPPLKASRPSVAAALSSSLPTGPTEQW